MTAAEMATVQTPVLVEASGAAVSQTHDGVLWAHNDDGRTPAVIALGLDGSEIAEFVLPGISGVDIEDLALVDGVLYLADIGDNRSRREGIAVYRFPEPDPVADEAIGDVETINFRYPEGAIDAESLLIDPITGQLIVIAKKVRIGGGDGTTPLSAAPAPIFVTDPPFDLEGTTVLEQRGTLALDELLTVATGESPEGTISDLGLSGVATAADIRPDGTAVAVRTYQAVWLFDRGSDQTVPEALSGVPCQAPTILEEQGEALAFLDDSTNSFVTISEGLNPAINVTRQE